MSATYATYFGAVVNLPLADRAVVSPEQREVGPQQALAATWFTATEMLKIL